MSRTPPAWPRPDGAGAASAPTSRSPSGPPSRVEARPQRARVRRPSSAPPWGRSTGHRRTAASQAARATAPEARGAARSARSHCADASHPAHRDLSRCSGRAVARSSAGQSSSPPRHPRWCDPALTARSPERAASRSDPGPTGASLPDRPRSDDQQPAPWLASAPHGAPAYPLRDRTGIHAESFARTPYDAGLIPMFFPDYKPVEDPQTRAAYEAAWGVTLDPKRGLTVVETMDAIHADRIRGMYVMGENPAMSDPDVQHAREALAKLEHLVVQDIFLTETAKYADVVLPASAWPEKDGTVTNTNRQVQIGRKALPLPGQARQDLEIIIDLAKRLGLPWSYGHVSEVFDEMTTAMPSLANITWERLERENSVTYPVDSPTEPGHDIVFGDGFPTATGRGRFVPAKLVSPAEEPDAEYPMVLTTGRQLEHWHTGSMTRRASVLDDLEPEAVACISARDLEKLGIRSGGRIRVSTRRGAIELKARVDGAIPPGLIFIPFAYAEAAANVLTNPQLDPFGKIPEFKYCAAKMERAGEFAAAAE